MTGTNNEISLRKAAIIAGFGYLMVFLVSILGTSFALDKLIVLGDAVTTSNNIMANKLLFRFGITCWIIVIAFDALGLSNINATKLKYFRFPLPPN